MSNRVAYRGGRRPTRNAAGASASAALQAILARLGGSWLDGYDTPHITIATGISGWQVRQGTGTFSQPTAGKQPTFAVPTATFAAASLQELDGPAMSTYASTTGWYWLFVASPTSIAGANVPGGYFNNDSLFSDSNGFGMLCLRNTPALQCGAWNGSTFTAAEATGVTLGSFQALEGSYDNATLSARVGSAAAVTQALAGPIGGVGFTQPALIGVRTAAAVYYNGGLRGGVMVPAAVSAADKVSIRAAVGAIYGVPV